MILSLHIRTIGDEEESFVCDFGACGANALFRIEAGSGIYFQCKQHTKELALVWMDEVE